MQHFGRTLNWWVIVFLLVGALVVLDLCIQAIRRVYFPSDVDLMQRIEREEHKKLRRKSSKKAEEGQAEEVEMQRVESDANTPTRRNSPPACNPDYYFDHVEREQQQKQQQQPNRYSQSQIGVAQ